MYMYYYLQYYEYRNAHSLTDFPYLKYTVRIFNNSKETSQVLSTLYSVGSCRCMLSFVVYVQYRIYSNITIHNPFPSIFLMYVLKVKFVNTVQAFFVRHTTKTNRISSETTQTNTHTYTG